MDRARRLGWVLGFWLLSLPTCALGSKVMILSGGDLQAAVYLGMLDGLQNAPHPWKPDTLLSTCGASLAGALANTLPSSADQRAFLESRPVFELFRSIALSPRNSRITALVPRFLALRSSSARRYFPDLFRNILMPVPLGLDSKGDALTRTLYEPFQNHPGEFRSVMVAGKVLYSETDVYLRRLRGRQKLFREVFFTDAETSRDLVGLKAAVASLPGSTVDSSTEVLTGYTLWQAARASIADPFYINPMILGDDYFITGAVDLFPWEVARRLGTEIAMVYGTPYGLAARTVAAATWGYDHNSRLRSIVRKPADLWIDWSDSGQATADLAFSFSPTVSYVRGVSSSLPTDYGTYVTKVRQQWQFGRARALEALARPRGSQRHIRRPLR